MQNAVSLAGKNICKTTAEEKKQNCGARKATGVYVSGCLPDTVGNARVVVKQDLSSWHLTMCMVVDGKNGKLCQLSRLRFGQYAQVFLGNTGFFATTVIKRMGGMAIAHMKKRGQHDWTGRTFEHRRQAH